MSLLITSSACNIKCNILGYKEDSSVSSSALFSNSDNEISSTSGKEIAEDIFVKEVLDPGVIHTAKTFLDAVSPEVAIIMAGEKNRYGHPHKETIDKLESAGINTYITKLNGNILIGTDGKTYSINNNKILTGDLVAQPIKFPQDR